MGSAQIKGILLAGGKGSRMRPLTDFVSKQLLPIYNKPLIYYPLTSLILSGIQEILIISTQKDTPVLKNVMGDGSSLGISIEYAVQKKPKGAVEAFLIARDFIGRSPVCMILGDNIIYKAHFSEFIQKAFEQNEGASIFGCPVRDPERFGVIKMDLKNKQVLSLEEKPAVPQSRLASIGLYIYDETVVERAKDLRPGPRGELEITDLNQKYLNENRLKCYCLSRGDIWIDVGVLDGFSDAFHLIRLAETRMGVKIGCPEEAGYIMGNISKKQLSALIEKYAASPYGDYLKKILETDYT